jgi:hypothetical protein
MTHTNICLLSLSMSVCWAIVSHIVFIQGRNASSVEAPRAYGEFRPATTIDGIELLEEELYGDLESNGTGVEHDDLNSDFGYPDDSDDDDDDDDEHSGIDLSHVGELDQHDDDDDDDDDDDEQGEDNDDEHDDEDQDGDDTTVDQVTNDAEGKREQLDADATAESKVAVRKLQARNDLSDASSLTSDTNLSSRSGASERVSLAQTRILTDKDFERIEMLKLKRATEGTTKKRKHQELYVQTVHGARDGDC